MPAREYTLNKFESPKKSIGRPPQVFLTLEDRTLGAAEWSRILNIRISLILARKKRGWSDSDALTKESHSYEKHGLGRHPLTATWREMIRRCRNPKSAAFSRYGGSGIDVCQRWLELRFFLSDVGERPLNHTLDRVNNKGGYWCGHCNDCINKQRVRNWRWATAAEQQRNTSANKPITYNGKTQAAATWAEEFGVEKKLLYNRLRRGWNIERALTQSKRVIATHP